MSSKAQLNKAIEQFQNFSGHEAEEIFEIDMPEINSAWILGSLLDVAYETVRDGEVERYRHEFKKKSRPLLAVGETADGEQVLMIIGGSYFVDESGINDD